MLTFDTPWLLLLFLPIALLVFLTWRRLSLPFPRAQRSLILACRLALFALIITALAGPSLAQPVSRQAVVFVGDISASTLPQQAFMQDWINNAIKHKRPNDQVGIVAVGRNALVEQAVNTQVNFSQFESAPDTDYTDLAAGLRLAAAILPNDSQRRIVLLSDGQQNLEDALQEAQLLRQQGIRLDVVPLPAVIGPEARVDGLDAPGALRTGEHFVLRARLYSTVAQKATLRLYLDHTLLAQRSLNIVAGEQDVSFSLTAPGQGFHAYRLTLSTSEDTISQNNEASAFVNVQGPPRVLIIEGQPGAGRNILAALQATHIQATVGAPSDVPVSLDGLAGYDTLVLADVPAVDLGLARMQALQSFVRDLGRGLVVSGGQNSYGVGGYGGTPLEETLPMTMDIPQHKDNPTIAVVLIVESLETNTSINISKEAAKGVISLLTPRDYVGVSAAYGSLAIPMQRVTNKTAIDTAIDKLEPNDPASYLPDLIAAERALQQTNAKIKHVILLGDGDASDNYTAQALKMASEHITISVVGTNIGSYQDLTMLQQIATLSKGRFYRADDPNAIPQILLDETRQAARRAIIAEAFTPAIVGTHPILAGLGALPQLNGYVSTTPKPAAQVVLISHLDDPVLAIWQYGLGRVAAWTSDALGLWTANWLRWSDDARWWANLVTWTLPTPDSQLIVSEQITGSSAQVTVELPAGMANTTVSLNSQQVLVSIVTPDLRRRQIELEPGAPGRWEGSFPLQQVGVYLLRATWQARGAKNTGQLSTTTGLVVPYSPEFLTTGIDLNFLSQLARTGGGSVIALDDYGAVFAANLPPVYAALSITFWLFALAALLLPIDIALRRLSSLEFLGIGYRWLTASLRRTTSLDDTSENRVLDTMRAHRAERKGRTVRPQTSETSASTRSANQKHEQAVSAERKAPALKEQSALTTSKLIEEKRRQSNRSS